jgi:hypothetical protein
MKDRRNKPRVFLSHSKEDIVFIRKICEDLRKCQVDPWIDEDNIRHGKSWLDSIFEDGIPTCDSVIVYFTSYSLQSQIVKKEIDASILSQLNDKRVAFLPYVESKLIRNDLRPDIQALHIQEWNDKNYNTIFPKVVAEIWRSFMERSIHIATQDEQNRRLRLELELQEVRQEKSGNVFSASEDADFNYIWNILNRESELVIEEKREIKSKEDNAKESVTLGYHKFSLNMLSLVANLISFCQTYHSNSIRYELEKQCGDILSIKQEKIFLDAISFEDPCNELKTYGLVHGYPEKPNKDSFDSLLSDNKKFSFTKKMYRFRYWLAFNKKFPENVSIKRLKDNIFKIG